MAVLLVTITTARDVATLQSRLQVPGGNQEIANRLISYITSVATGTESAMSVSIPPSITLSIQESSSKATGTFSFSGVSAPGDTILIAGIVFTAVASGAVAQQWNVGTTAAQSAANLALAINASSSPIVKGAVTASATGSVVTVLAILYGRLGNAVTIAKGVDVGAVITVSGPKLTGGSDDPNRLTLNF